MSTHRQPPKELDAIVDLVLAYRPKARTDGAKKRKRKTKKIEREANKPKPDPY